jgi:hypothetical protein
MQFAPEKGNKASQMKVNHKKEQWEKTKHMLLQSSSTPLITDAKSGPSALYFSSAKFL